jgi:predicted XRE-type DNA-binding protein
MGFLTIYQKQNFYDKIEMESVKAAVFFVSNFEDTENIYSFEYGTKNPENHLENTLIIRPQLMTQENNIRNQITFKQNELIALERNERISDYDRKIKKEKLDLELEQWQLKLASYIEVNEEKTL